MIMEKVINKTITFEECVLSNEYYVTYIDIYLLSKEYDLPIILLCNTIIDLTITTEKYIIFNLNRKNNSYFFIKNRSLYDRKKLHNYKLIINASSVNFNIDEDLLDTPEYKLYSKIKNSIDNFQDVLGDYINNYSSNEKKLITKLKTKLKKQLISDLKEQGDPRILGNGDVFDQYPYSGENVKNFYSRYMDGEKIETHWVNPTDFEK